METSKINFWNRIKKAVLKFEDYEQFVKEPLQKAFGYFFKLMIIVVVLITIAISYKMVEQTNGIVKTIDEKFPNFKIQDNMLELDGINAFDYYFEDFNLNVIMDSETSIYNKQNQSALMFLKDRIVFNINGYVQTIYYKDLQVENLSKNNLINYYKTSDWKTEIIVTSILIMVVAYILITMIILANVLMLFLIGSIINVLIRMELSYKDICKVSIYAMTLPVFLYMLYMIVNIIWGVTIRYFDIAYKSISYVYLVTVLLMLKSDAIKNKQELMKIMEVQKEVKKEIERDKQEERDKQKKEKQEKEKKEEKNKKEKEEPDGEPQT